MTTSNPRDSRQKKWVALTENLQAAVPHLAAHYDDLEAFVEVRLKAMSDGTVLAIVKGYSADGGPIVVFGSGYDVSSALLAVDSSIQGGNWRVDKPWSPPGK